MLSRLQRTSSCRKGMGTILRHRTSMCIMKGYDRGTLMISTQYMHSMPPKDDKFPSTGKQPSDSKAGHVAHSAGQKTIIKEEKKSIAIQAKDGLVHVAHVIADCIRNPGATWEAIKKEAKHYWVGTKLLWVEIKIAKEILGRIASGHGMTRRERMQLIRTTMDLFRLVPFAIFVIVPFMELLLPVALKLFPNMLPSTFQDKLKKEEGMKMELQMRLAVAGFFQETLTEMANKRKDATTGGDGPSAGKDVLEFIEKARLGEPLPNETVIRIAGHFKDELTLANINRPQLVSMCQYMGLQPYGADAFLRFQLRTKLRAIKEDDRRILWEGLNSLTMLELREACNERGMRTIGLTEYGYQRQLQEWLDLSIQKNIPISLLIMSRAFMLTSKYAHPEDVLKSSMSSLDSDTINEVVLAVAKPEEESSIEIKVRKLESIEFQKEMIREERDDKEEAKQSQKKSVEAEKAVEKSSIVTPLLAPVAPVIGKVVEKVQAVIKTATNAATTPPKSASISLLPPQTEPATSGKIQSTTDSVVSTQDPSAEPTSIANYDEGLLRSTTKFEKQEEKAKELSVNEIQILGDLARGPSLDREKAELAKIEALVEAVVVEDVHAPAAEVPLKKDGDAATAISALSQPALNESMEVISEKQTKSESRAISDVEKVPVKEPEPKSDPSMMRMQVALNTMVDKLKDRIVTTEKALEDKLPKLDIDGDGELSNDELKDAMQTLLKRAPTDKEAAEMVKELDKDNDGKVSVAELINYAKEKQVKFEVEDLEAHLKEAQTEKTVKPKASK